MPRRVRLPGADEIFRPTASTERPSDPSGSGPKTPPARSASGRVRHDEKMTVYLTADELMAIEKARLELRTMLGRKIDRGRLVRAALALALEDLSAEGVDSPLAARLKDA